jgi:hypothetical protein
MARQLIIHAGQHKTGSTSIQQYLARHHDALRRKGVFAAPAWASDLSAALPHAEGCNAGAIAHAILRNGLLTPGRLRGKHPATPDDDKPRRLRAVNAWLRAVPEDTVILSSEAFSFLREACEFELVDALAAGMEWRAVMFLREPMSWLQSWRHQLAHAGLIDRPGAVAGQGIFDLEVTSWLTDRDSIRSFWRGRCTFHDYEEALAQDGSVIPALLRDLGLDPHSCPPWDGLFLNRTAKKLARAGRDAEG